MSNKLSTAALRPSHHPILRAAQCQGSKASAKATFSSSIASSIQALKNAMDDRSKAPFVVQDATEIMRVLKAMDDHVDGRGKGGFKARKKTFNISDKSGRTVDSYQLQDWDYKKPNLPTYARGLFTHSNNGKLEIAARGYDKFFNVGEVRNTEWRNVEANTRGPYELSVKENGCIIFIAGLDDHTLLVTSKHSTGFRGDDSANHALTGEEWVDKQLSAIGKTRADLAKQLRQMNVTAVAELCDDEFEEHVLEYGPDSAGLYLHGLNLNLPEFTTYPAHLVTQFGKDWGFKEVMYIVENDINKVKGFLDGVAETGNYAGRDTEGFVIRCQIRESPSSSYHDWFFKYKFEEPYLMYRQWRECTKAVIAGKLPKIRKHKKVTEEYLTYARRQLGKDPNLGKRYNQNHGIIAMREGFLKEKGMKGSDLIKIEHNGGEESEAVTRNVVLIPVATIGCGKTTVAVALSKLFDWGHEQNDNIQGKGRPARFALAITNSLIKHPVMIADRNNHQRRERQQIIEDVQNVVPEAKFVALHYVHDRARYDEIKHIMRDRVLTRGDNHQTIQAGSKSQSEIIGIMDGFMQRFEPVDAEKRPDYAFDLVIDLDVAASSRENLQTIVEKLHAEYPKLFKMPTDDQMDASIENALNSYRPDIKHEIGKPGKENRDIRKASKQASSPVPPNGHATKAKPPKLEYFSITVPAARVAAILDAVYNNSVELGGFYNQLKSSHRVQDAFHVTLIHRASVSQHADYWNKLTDQWHQKFADGHGYFTVGGDGGVSLGTSRVHLERVVWDDRLMCVVARLIDAEVNGFTTVNRIAHITVGTAADSIKPKESNDLLARWLDGGSAEGQSTIRDLKIPGSVVLDGQVKGVIAR